MTLYALARRPSGAHELLRAAVAVPVTVTAHEVQGDGLVTGSVRTLPAEPEHVLPEAFAPLAELLQLLATRIGPQQFPATRRLDDASWVGYRLAELLPLPLSIKQSMLEVNDANLRLAALKQYLEREGLLQAV